MTTRKGGKVRETVEVYRAGKPSALVDTRVVYCKCFRQDHAVIVPLTVRDILDEQTARKLA